MLSAANDAFKALNQAILNAADVKTNDELVTKVQNDIKTLGNNVQENVAKISEEVSFVHINEHKKY